MAISEYDAFGPWIYEISEQYPLPPLFEPFYGELADSLLLLKIPREIERKNATPDMELYDYVLGAGQDQICILKRIGHTVEQTRIRYCDVTYLRIFREFLQGVFTIGTEGGEYRIPFNTVSMALMQRFARLIRERYTPEKAKRRKRLTAVDQSGSLRDPLFVNLLRELRAEGEQFSVGAVQAAASVRHRATGLLGKLLQVLKTQTLPDTVHLLGERELLVIERVSLGKRKSKYAYRFTYLPLDKLSGVHCKTSGSYEKLMELELRLPGTTMRFALIESNRGAANFYQALREVYGG